MDEKNLLERSRDILAYEDKLALRYEGYYERLADQPRLSEDERAVLRSDVTREAETLKEAAAQLRQAHQWAADRADELTTRLREGQESSQRRGLFRRAPATVLPSRSRAQERARPPAARRARTASWQSLSG